VRTEKVRLSVAPRDLQQLQRCIVQHARPDEADLVERLLGQLATLEGMWPDWDDAPREWVPSAGTEELAQRALEALEVASRRRRFRRRATDR
jgi:hypothetical protein